MDYNTDCFFQSIKNLKQIFKLCSLKMQLYFVQKKNVLRKVHTTNKVSKKMMRSKLIKCQKRV